MSRSAKWLALEDVIHAWFAAVTGLSAIWANQAAPPPAEPYGTLRLTTLGRVGQDIYIMPDQAWPSYMAKIAGQRAWNLSINIYGDGAAHYMSKIEDAMKNRSSLALLYKAQIAAVDVVTAADITAYIVSIDGVSSSITSGAGATKQTIRDALVVKLAADILAHPAYYVDGMAVAALAGSTTKLTITAQPGVDFDVQVGSRLGVANTQEAVGLGISRSEGISEMPALLDASWQERAHIDLFLLSAVSIPDWPDIIDKVEITNEITGDTFDVEIAPA